MRPGYTLVKAWEYRGYTLTIYLAKPAPGRTVAATLFHRQTLMTALGGVPVASGVSLRSADVATSVLLLMAAKDTQLETDDLRVWVSHLTCPKVPA